MRRLILDRASSIMSGLLERIVRRRRASASSRLGPPTQNGHPSPYDVPYLNGHATELTLTHVNGSAGAIEAPEAVDEIETPEVIEEIEASELAEVVEVIEPVQTPEPVAPPEAVEVPLSEPEIVEAPEDIQLPAVEPEPVEGPDVEAVEEGPDAVEEDLYAIEEDLDAVEEPESELEHDQVTESDPPPDEDPVPEDLDQPPLIEDESPTMEHRVLVLDEAEAKAEADEPVSEPAPMPERAPERGYAPTAEPRPPEPQFRGRGRVRRRARYLRRLRELQLRDIGGFALELHRFGRDRPDLLQAKIADAAQTDAELRALEQALHAEEPLRELREAGIGGVCSNCGAVHGSEDRFCAACGEPVGGNPAASRRPTEFDDYFGQG